LESKGSSARGETWLTPGQARAASAEITRARRAAGLTQRELADRLGVRLWLVDRWESGAKPLSREQVDEILATLGLSLAVPTNGQAPWTARSEPPKSAPTGPPTPVESHSSSGPPAAGSSAPPSPPVASDGPVFPAQGQIQHGLDERDELQFLAAKLEAMLADQRDRLVTDRADRPEPPETPEEGPQGPNNGRPRRFEDQNENEPVESGRLLDRGTAPDGSRPRREAVASMRVELDALHRDLEPLLAALLSLGEQLRAFPRPEGRPQGTPAAPDRR